MKKFTVLASAALIFAACNKEKNSPPPANLAAMSAVALDSAHYEKRFDDIITTISYGIIDLVADQNFRNLVSTEVAKQFDGDDNVLIKQLDLLMSQKGINLKNLIRASLNKYNKSELIPLVDQAVDGFRYFNDTLYSQIYIPFIESKNITSTTPTISLNYNDDPVLVGIKKVGNTLVSTNINESYAKNNNIYVVSINETVNNLGILPTQVAGVGPLLKPFERERFLAINQVFVTDKKEGWGNGRADLTVARVITRLDSCSIESGEGLLGNVYCKLANTDLNKWYTVGSLYGNWEVVSRYVDGDIFEAEWSESQNEKLTVFLFEKDVRKKFEKSVEISNCPSVILYYTSKESAYGYIYPQFSDFTSTSSYPMQLKEYLPQLGGGASFKFKGYRVN